MNLKLKTKWFLFFMSGLLFFPFYCNFNYSKVDLLPRFSRGAMQNGWIQPGNFASDLGYHVEIQGETVSPLPLDTHLCKRFNIHWDFKRKYIFFPLHLNFLYFLCIDHLLDSVKTLMNGKQGNEGQVRVRKRRYNKETISFYVLKW